MADALLPAATFRAFLGMVLLLACLFRPGPAFSAGSGVDDPHAGHSSQQMREAPDDRSAAGIPAAAQPAVGTPVAGGDFAVTGTPPSAMSLAGNAGPVVPPPSMVEHLGAFVPEGIAFRDEEGRPLDPRSLMDVPVIVAPVFLSCPAGCSTLQSSLAASLPEVDMVPGKDYRVLVVSFDDSDSPALAARKKRNYLAAMNFAFPPEALRYLTGDAASVKRFMDALGFPFIRVGPGNFSHPLGLIVLAPGGKIVRYLYGQGFFPFDLTMALSEAATGQPGLSIKRVLAYCFSYDPEARGYVFDIMRVAGITILFGAGVFLFILLRGGKSGKQGG